MATHTTYYNLTKPSTNDKVNIGILNDNADIIDTALHNKVNNDDTQNITTSANKCMLSDGVTSAEEALDKLQIKSVIFNETTSASGRIINKFPGMEIIVLKAHCYNESHIVIPYTYESGSTINTGFKILSSEGMAVIENRAVQLKVYYIEL